MRVPRLPHLCADRPPGVRWKKISAHCLFSLLCLHCVASATELDALQVVNSSDFVSTYYALYSQQQANASAALAPVDIQPSSLPDEITDRLKNASLAFEDLPALMQRALLWDSGYSINDGDDSTSVARIYTLCGTSMANLALSQTQLKASSCKIETCSAANTTTAWQFARQCESSQLYAAANCACASVMETAASQDSVLWSNDTMEAAFAGASVVPMIRVRRHESATGNGTTHVFAIHTSDRGPDLDSCASVSSPPFVIPCVPFNEDDARWCSPSTSALMTQWIQEYAREGLQSISSTASSTYDSTPSSSDSSAVSMTEDSNGIQVDPGFYFSGESSDLSQQFYRRHLAGDDSQFSKIDFNGRAIPSAIKQRLSEVSLSFDTLSPLLQRALLWDSGYSFDESDTTSLVTIYTQCGLSMADLAIPSTDLRVANCSLDTCFDSDSNESFSRVHNDCSGDTIVHLSRCATTDLSTSANGSVWATGGQAESIPVVTIKRHYWTSGNQTTLLYGIHTVQTDNTAVSECPAHGSMIIPCVVYSNITSAVSWCRPTAGALVTSWLRVAAKQQQFSLFYLIPILISAALAVVGVAFCVRQRPWEQVAAKDDGGRNTMTTAAGPDGYLNAGGMFSCIRHSMLSMDGFLSSSPPTLSLASSGSSSIQSPDHTVAATPTSILHSLMNDPMLFHRHIPFHELQAQHLLSKDMHKEVWYSLYRGQAVAVKRLVKTTHKQPHFELLESLAHEISVLVNLRHANIVAFVGVSWNSANNLCLVSEYVENGELLHYLRAQAQSELFTWKTAIKLNIATGIAQALRYLHHVRNQAVLHGNLTSRHVLVSAQLTAKLIDFGQSRCLDDRNRRSGSDSQPKQLPECSEALYWTAPEVLAGQKYSSSAVIYSFGVVLSELDTHHSPYDEALGQSPVEILQQVVCGDLQPSMSDSCPPEIVLLMQSCLALDPASRPTADAIVSILKDLAAER